jgi:hypothetical protein
MRFDYWYSRPDPAALQRLQDSFNDNVGRTAREHAQEQMRRKAESNRANLIAAMVLMVGNDEHARPDLWAAFAFDRDELAALIADYLLARERR